MKLNHSPANILAAYLDAYAVDNPPPGNPDQTYYARQPDHTTAPDCLCVYDTAGKKNGRMLVVVDGKKVGQTVHHPGYQVRSRAHTPAAAWALLAWAMAAMDVAAGVTVEVDGTSYRLHAVTSAGSPLTLPPAPETDLAGYTTNGTVTITQQT